MTVEEARAHYAFLAELAMWWSIGCRPDDCSECMRFFRRLDVASIALDNATAAAHQNVRAPAWLERIAW